MGLKDLNYKPRQATVRLVFDDELRQALDNALTAYAIQRAEENKDGQGLGSDLPKLKAVLDEAEAQADKAAVEFTFRALSRRRLEDLMEQCPPTSEQLEQWRETTKTMPLVARSAPAFDVDTFPPRLIAASLVAPEASEAEVVELWESPEGWSAAIWDELWEAAWGVNQEVSTRPT